MTDDFKPGLSKQVFNFKRNFRIGCWNVRTLTEVGKLKQTIKEMLIYRMDRKRAPMVVLDAKLDSKRRRGRPKTRWINDVENDLRRTGNRNWRQKLIDRTEWRAVVREVKAKL